MNASQRCRAIALAACLGGLLVLVLAGTAGDRRRALGPSATLVDLVTGLAGVAVLVALGWLTLLAVLLVLEPAGDTDLTARAGCPPALRRLLLVLCGVAAVGAMAVPAQAAPGAASHDDHGTSALLDGLPMPERPTGEAPGAAVPTATPATTAARAPAAGHQHTVRPGDSLWDIARAQLPADASAQEITRAWHRLYDANRRGVGADPDLIHPGTTLGVPSTIQEEQP